MQQHLGGRLGVSGPNGPRRKKDAGGREAEGEQGAAPFPAAGEFGQEALEHGGKLVGGIRQAAAGDLDRTQWRRCHPADRNFLVADVNADRFAGRQAGEQRFHRAPSLSRGC